MVGWVKVFSGKASRKEHAVHQLKDDDAMSGLSEAEQRERLRDIAKHVLKDVKSAQMHKIPMLPGIAARAMDTATNPKVTIRELEAIIQPDPMITARVLAIANSPLYGTDRGVKSLHNAIMRLGVSLMRDILYQTVAEAHIFRGSSEGFLRWQRIHAVSVAYLSRSIQKLIKEQNDSIFLCGLMHDVGETILHQIFDQDPPPGVSMQELPSISNLIHPHVGQMVAERWHLPSEIQEATRRHHVYSGFSRGEGYSLIGNIVAAADRLALHAGLTERGDPATGLDLRVCSQDLQVFEDLGIEREQVTTLAFEAMNLRDQVGL